MKHVLPNKERGVVMILILVFLTMFAIMISAFLFMTTSMSDSAANSLALYEKGETAQERSSADIDSAIRTLVVGTLLFSVGVLVSGFAHGLLLMRSDEFARKSGRLPPEENHILILI